MKLALVGVGSAGGRIVNQIRESEKETGRNVSDGNLLVFDTSEPDRELGEIPHDQYITIGDTHREIDDRGVGGDVGLAVDATKEELYDIRRVFDFITVHELDGILLVAGLGGGTGGGTTAVLVDELREMYDKPIYALGVLPSEDEGDRPVLNAARSLKSLVPKVDNAILFDNDVWGPTERNTHGGYERANRELAVRITSLLGAGELDGPKVAENAIDSSDIIRTLDTGGVSSIGYASIQLEDEYDTLFSRLYDLIGNSGDESETDPAEIKRLVRQAVDSRLTLPCDIASAERILIVLSGPPSKLSRRGFESARYWLERETDTVEVLAGDEPNEGSSKLTAAVLLSNVTDVPRIDALQERAVTFQERGSE